MSKLSADVPVRIAIVGCGHVLPIYLRTLSHFNHVRVIACSDIVPERAEAAAATANAQAWGLKEILNSDGIDLVVNLTPVTEHHPISCAVLSAGKHLYSEKPLASTATELTEIVKMAEQRSLWVATAPDTFLGAGLQTVRTLIDSGTIGSPVGFAMQMLSRGNETWHPAPHFMYGPGGGPLMDFGPYAITAITALLGPATAVTAAASRAFAQRTITSEPLKGQKIDVTIPTHFTALLEMEGGLHGSLVCSYDTPASGSYPIEIFGTEGSIRGANPSTFGGPVFWRRMEDAPNTWREAELKHGFAENSRGLGLADLAMCMRSGEEPRAGIARAKHVLEVIYAALHSAESGGRVPVTSRVNRPKTLPINAEQTYRL